MNQGKAYWHLATNPGSSRLAIIFFLKSAALVLMSSGLHIYIYMGQLCHIVSDRKVPGLILDPAVNMS